MDDFNEVWCNVCSTPISVGLLTTRTDYPMKGDLSHMHYAGTSAEHSITDEMTDYLKRFGYSEAQIEFIMSVTDGKGIKIVFPGNGTDTGLIEQEK